MTSRFRSAIPVITATDLAGLVRFYVDVLGFRVDFEWGEPVFYVGLVHDTVEFHLISAASDNARQAPGTANVSVLVDDVDALFARCRDGGATVLAEPGNRPYGLRDCSIRDPEGNVLNLGADVA